MTQHSHDAGAVSATGTAVAAGVPVEEPVLAPGHTFATIGEQISGVIDSREQPVVWFLTLAIAGMFAMLLPLTMLALLAFGVGIWGINIPVGWGFAIVNFVWWIGIGHAGTLISAVLLLVHQQWRTSINRFSEAMTIFAVMCAGMFPLFHMGRPWFAYWMGPYPNTMLLWPQFRSPLAWDVFAVTTYFLVSLMFWYVGLIPDFATLRDRSKHVIGKWGYGFFALGWRGSAAHWQRYETAYLLLAGLATPLVVSVHTVVSFDFAVGVLPGWHSTIFPPFFVAGAIYSGFAMVLTLALPVREFYGMKDFITDYHLDKMAKVMLATGLMVSYGYLNEAFMAWYSQNPYEMYLTWNRMFGPYWWSYWALILCNTLIPQTLWVRSWRLNVYWLFVVSIVVNIGMWLERFVIVITSLHRDFLPSSWGMYTPTFWDWTFYLGTLGFFFTMMCLFVRFLPMISIAEMRLLLLELKHEAAHAAHVHVAESHAVTAVVPAGGGVTPGNPTGGEST
jgi:Ni/Fe-hydrogenase subunit HybB-like protein